MSEQQIPHDPELSAIEAALGLLAPSKNQLDRDRLMFEAGRAAHRPASSRRWTWPAISAGLSIGLAVALMSRPDPRVIERVVYVRESPSPPEPAPVVILSEVPPPPAAAFPVPGFLGRYERLDRRLSRFDAEALPEPPLILSSNLTAFDPTSEASGTLLRSEIAKLLKPGESL